MLYTLSSSPHVELFRSHGRVATGQERVAPGATNESDESSGSPPLALGTWWRESATEALGSKHVYIYIFMIVVNYNV